MRNAVKSGFMVKVEYSTSEKWTLASYIFHQYSFFSACAMGVLKFYFPNKFGENALSDIEQLSWNLSIIRIDFLPF